MDTSSFMSRQAEVFRQFARLHCTQDPLYVAICQATADAPELLALMAHAPPMQRIPNLLLAALHERVLAGTDHRLREYYPSAGGRRLPDAELPAALLDFARWQNEQLSAHLSQRSTQTNEIGRCAVLWPALQRIAHLSGKQDLALLDFGSSAGLNLGVDLYRYDYGEFQLGEPDGLTIDCQWLGDAKPPTPTSWRLASRVGLDPFPIDVNDDDAVRWLRACLWPHDRVRATRLDQAVAIARQNRFTVQQADDCTAAIEPWLRSLPAHVQPVVFNSWVLYYFDEPSLARHRAVLEPLVRERGLAWLSAERASQRPAGMPLPPLDPSADEASATLWTLQAGANQAALAWSHPHGKWVQWLEIERSCQSQP